MNYNQALMIIRNATSGYTAGEIKTAAVFVLGTIDATEEDILDAGNALGYAEQMQVSASFSSNARGGDLNDHPFSGAISAGDY